MNLYKIACTLQGGTFVNSELMNRVIEAYRKNPTQDNIIVSDYISKIVKEYCPEVRKVVADIITKGWPLPAICSSIEYIDCYRSMRLPTPVIQLVKDCIAENGFERLDIPGIFFGDWKNPNDIVEYK